MIENVITKKEAASHEITIEIKDYVEQQSREEEDSKIIEVIEEDTETGEIIGLTENGETASITKPQVTEDDIMTTEEMWTEMQEMIDNAYNTENDLVEAVQSTPTQQPTISNRDEQVNQSSNEPDSDNQSINR